MGSGINVIHCGVIRRLRFDGARLVGRPQTKFSRRRKRFQLTWEQRAFREVLSVLTCSFLPKLRITRVAISKNYPRVQGMLSCACARPREQSRLRANVHLVAKTLRRSRPSLRHVFRLFLPLKVRNFGGRSDEARRAP